MTTLVLAASLDAGTKKLATPPPTVNPIDQFMAEVQTLDPKGLIVQEVRYIGTMNEAMAVVTDAFNRRDYQSRLQIVER